METFPYLGTTGFNNNFKANHTVKVYGNNEWRRWVRNNTVRYQQRVTLNFTEFLTVKTNAIVDFMLARWNAPLDEPENFEFLLYNPYETFVMTGDTGLYVAIFESDEFDVENSSFCSYNFSLDFLLLRSPGDSSPSETFGGNAAPF